MPVSPVQLPCYFALYAATTVGASTEVATANGRGVTAIADAVPKIDFVDAAVEACNDETAKALVD